MASAPSTLKAGWEVKTLGEVSSIFTDGNWVESKDQSPDGIRLIQTGNIGCGDFKDRRDKSRFISDETFVRLRCTEVLKGDCLVSRLPDPVGRSCIIPATGEKMITAVDCTIIRFKPEKVFPAFFNYFSQSKEYLLAVDEKCTGATRRRISRKNLGLVTIPIPPLPEQERIVGILDEAFEGIAAATAQAEKNLHNARELFQSVLQSTFSQKGEDWVERQLSEISEKITDGTHQTPRYFENGYMFLSSKNVKDGVIDWDDIKFIDKEQHIKMQQRLAPRLNDILLRKNGAGFGKAALVNRDVIFDVYVSLAVIRPLDSINPAYLLHFINSPSTMQQFNKRVKGAGVPNLHLKEIREVVISFPISLPTQQAIVEKLDALSEETKRLEAIYERKKAALTELKQSLLQKAFAGEL
jgi:type I restriction enzyme S subunit